MKDLRTLLRIIARHKGKLLLSTLVVSAALFLAGGEKIEFLDISPDDAYRLEYYTVRRYQRLLHWQMEEPCFVRLYRNTDNKYFGESKVVDFFGGTGGSLWLIDRTGQVSVGRDIVFDGVPPITPAGEELPIPNFRTEVAGEEASEIVAP